MSLFRLYKTIPDVFLSLVPNVLNYNIGLCYPLRHYPEKIPCNYKINSLSNESITKLLILTKLKSSFSQVFVTTMVTVMLYAYDYLEVTLTQMKNIKLE